MSHWISEAYIALCERNEQLTLDECRQLSLEDVVSINDAHHEARAYTGLHPAERIRVVVERILQPPLPDLGALDFTQVVGLARRLVVASDTEKAEVHDLKNLVLPYHNQNEAMDTVASLIIKELPRGCPDQTTLIRFITLGEILLDMAYPLCGETAPTFLVGKCWLAQRMMQHCYAGFVDWKNCMSTIHFLA